MHIVYIILFIFFIFLYFAGPPMHAMEDLHLELYSDADFASDLETRKSTSGMFLVLVGPNTFFPLSGVSKKQSAVSHSTPEAEIVAAAQALRTVGLPALDLWDTIFLGGCWGQGPDVFHGRQHGYHCYPESRKEP